MRLVILFVLSVSSIARAGVPLRAHVCELKLSAARTLKLRDPAITGVKELDDVVYAAWPRATRSWRTLVVSSALAYGAAVRRGELSTDDARTELARSVEVTLDLMADVPLVLDRVARRRMNRELNRALDRADANSASD